MIKLKELVRRIINYHKSSGRIYGNHLPIYKNDAPICHNLEAALVYILEVSPEVYEDISNFVSKNFATISLKVLISNLDVILNDCPEELRESITFIKDLLKSALVDD